MRLAFAVTATTLFLTTLVHAAEVPAVVAAARQRIEATDARATGRLVRVDASGKRTSNAISLKAHWFPGALRVLVEITPSKTPAPGSEQEARSSILLEMRPEGQTTIRIFRPRETTSTSLPFARWSEGVSGGDFDYEDFLQPEFFWKTQSIVKTAKLGARDCDVLKSTPGASERSHYATVQTWIDQTTGYPIYVEKTPKNAGAVKEFTSSGLTQANGVWAAKQVEVKTNGRPGSTLLLLERGSAKANLTAKDFSLESIAKFVDHP